MDGIDYCSKVTLLADTGSRHGLCRYHSAKTLRLMNRYRIGRIDGTWVYLTPPIRGGIYRSAAEDDSTSSSDDDDSDSYLASTNSSKTSIDVINDIKLDQPYLVDSHLTNRSSHVTHPSPVNGTSACTATYEDVPTRVSVRKSQRRISSLNPEHQSPEEYTSFAVQNEIDSDIRDYPSLDAQTQQSITKKYQALHQRIKDEGFYDCRYTEYGKELVRYSLLFALFIVCLRAEWHLTSAAFLGLFWVRKQPLQVRNPNHAS